MVFDESAYAPFAVLEFPMVFDESVNSHIAVLEIACQNIIAQLPFIANDQLPIAVFHSRIPSNPFPTVIPLITASAVVTRLPDAPERRNDSMLFRLKTRSVLSVVPMKSVRGLVPTFPVSPQPAPTATCHVALPEASLVSTYPEVAPDDIRRL